MNGRNVGSSRFFLRYSYPASFFVESDAIFEDKVIPKVKITKLSGVPKTEE